MTTMDQGDVEAWAVADAEGLIDINTVFGARRGAIVSWLEGYVDVAISAADNDDTVEKLWAANKGDSEAVRVVISRVQ